MAAIVVFHHALGRTAGVQEFAAGLGAGGHEVTVPDLFDGRTFADVADGVAYAQAVGFGTLVDRAAAVLDEVPPGQLLLGFSLGVVAAQQLAATRPGVLGAVLCHACLPPDPGGWPPGVPVRVHAAENDPWFTGDGDLDAARALVDAAADAELYLYPGDGHLFAEPASPDHDPAAASLLRRRVLDFADGLSRPRSAPTD